MERFEDRPSTQDKGPLRASDAEREEAVLRLGSHYADGRLDRAEFDDRVNAALAARTREELTVLFLDLPGGEPSGLEVRPRDARAAFGPGDPAGPVPAGHGRVPRARFAPPGWPATLAVPVLLTLAVLAVVHGHPPFPLFPLLFMLAWRRRHRGYESVHWDRSGHWNDWSERNPWNRWNREARPRT